MKNNALKNSKITIYDCKKCGWQWGSRLNGIPKSCPKCKFKKFWREPQPKSVKKEKLPKISGGQSKYGFEKLGPGQSGNIDWPTLPSGELDQKGIARINGALNSYCRRNGIFFWRTPSATGLTITRKSSV